MSPDPAAPTPEDLARDLAADLELCERLQELVPRIMLHSLLENFSTPDAERIAAARTGWPAALRRALWAEAELARRQGAGRTEVDAAWDAAVYSQRRAEEAEARVGELDARVLALTEDVSRAIAAGADIARERNALARCVVELEQRMDLDDEAWRDARMRQRSADCGSSGPLEE